MFQTKTQSQSPLQQIELEAAAFAARHRGQVTPALYVDGTSVKMTKERAYATMLEEHPEAYAAYRDQHNAAPLVAQLQKAGFRLAR